MQQKSTLGEVLVKMGAITHKQLCEAIEEHDRSSEENRLAHLLVANGVCTKEQVEIARAAQEGLSSGYKHEQAMAISDIASYRKRQVNKRREGVMNKAKKITGRGYPAVAVKLAE